jgi:Dynamin central region
LPIKGALLLRTITQFSTDFGAAIDGKLTELSVNELYGGARINYTFNEIFANFLNNLDPLDGLTTNDIFDERTMKESKKIREA